MTKGWVDLMESNYELFQRFAADYLCIQKETNEAENWKETIEKDYFCYGSGEGKTTKMMRLDVPLTNELQKQVNKTICVIRFQNPRREMVYWVLYKKNDSYSALSFVNKRNGMVTNKIGKLNEKMRFYTYGVEKDEFSTSLLYSFRDLLKEHTSFRLLSVTGLLCFKER